MTSGSLGKITRNLQTRPKNGGAGDGSKFTEKTRTGLVRVTWAPRGVDPEKLEKSDLGVYRRFLRWQRLRTIQHMMGHVDGSRFQNVERVVKCFRVRVVPNVQVLYSSQVKRAHYGGLATCGSVWSCPVCAAKITERRRAELEGANDHGLAKFMVTYTMQHRQADKLKSLLHDLANGLRDMKNSRGYKSFLKRWQIVGAVTGLEIMVSDANGWHPHKHALMYSTLPQSEINAQQIKIELAQLYISTLARRGRYVHDDIGLNVRASDDIKTEYLAKFGNDEQISKWTLQAEITKSPVKTGRDADHFHPFELVDMYQAGNMHAGGLYLEYAGAMKGKKQLVYTRGLRARLGMGQEITDDEIANAQDKSASLFALLSAEDWAHVLKHEKRAQLLEVASTGNYNAFVVWMRAIGRDQFAIEKN